MKKQNIAFILNSIIFVTEIIGFAIAIKNNGFAIFGLYTQLSNLVLMLAAGMYINDSLIAKDKMISRKTAMLKYLATCLVTVTFMVVMFIFVPMSLPDVDLALKVVFGQASFFHHFLCPIIAFISFIFFENDLKITTKDVFLATAPTLLYAIVSTSLNVLKIVEGPYPFLYVYKQPVWLSIIWFIAIPGASFIFAFLIVKIKRMLNK